MKEHTCLNCAAATTGKYCANCGQKTGTHRITFKHFFMHDVLHGVWHLERGILFTLKEALIRPGRAALDYIGGKRVRYYNVFYLSLLLIGIDLLIYGWNASSEQKTEPIGDDFGTFFHDHLKILLLAVVPLFALNGYLLFRRMKLNFAEHQIVAGFGFLGAMLLSVLFMLVAAVEMAGYANDFTEMVLLCLSFLISLYPFWVYANFAWRDYKFLGILWRMAVFYILISAELFVLMVAVLQMVIGKSDVEIG